MEVLTFRFFSSHDPHDDTPNWSRCYEWKYALDALAADPALQRIHNTCCGPDLIHKLFHERLLGLGRDLVNSDRFTTTINAHFRGYHIYDLLFPSKERYDAVLCISTLEELLEPKLIKSAFKNLLDQTNTGGRLIITCDYPKVDVHVLEDLVGKSCERPAILLNGATSASPDQRFSSLNVVLLDIRKTSSDASAN